MRQKRVVSVSMMAILGLFSPTQLFAFGLGPLQLDSALNQPFEAEIEVVSLRESEKGNLQVRLASQADFERAGLDRSFLLTQFEFEVIERAEGAVVRVTTSVPIKEPFLDFLLSASAGEGRLIRAYTVLLDPPTEGYQRRSESSNRLQTQSNRQSATAYAQSGYQVQRNDTLWNIARKVTPSNAVTLQQMMVALYQENPQAFQQNNMNSLRADAQLTVPDANRATQMTQADAMATINRQMAVWQQATAAANASVEASDGEADVSLEPMDIATEATAVEQDTMVSAQIDSESETTDSDQSEPQQDTPSEQTADDRLLVDQVAEDIARLKLVNPDEQGDQNADPTMVGDADVQKLSNQLTLAQETIEAQTQENIDFKNRMDALEEQLETMRRLLSLQDTDMARLQQVLTDQQNELTEAEALAMIADAQTNEAESETNTPEIDADASEIETDTTAVETGITEIEAEIAQIEAQSQQQSLVDADENVLAEQQTPEQESADTVISDDSINDSPLGEVLPNSEADLDNVYDDASTQRLTAETEPPLTELALSEVENNTPEPAAATESESSSWLTQAKSLFSAYQLPLLFAALLIILLLWLIIRQRNKAQHWETLSDGNANVNHEDALASTSNYSVTQQAETPQESHLQVPEKSTNELVEQADMFVGYADYVQARTALEQAYLQAPDNKLVATKLLYVLFKQQKSVDFLSVLSESEITADDEQWQDIAEWGHQLMPNNALFFSPQTVDLETPEQDSDTTTASDQSASLKPEPLAESDISDRHTAVDDSPIEFDLDQYTQPDDDTVSTETDDMRDTSEFLEFERIDSLNETVESAETESLELDTSNDEQADEWDFDLNLDETEDAESHATDLQIPEQVAAETETLEIDAEDLDTEEDFITATLDLSEYENADDAADLDFDLDDFDQVDEAETKLDLANAYIDMGDPEGAKGILDEVVNEGSDEQKQRAQRLLDALT